MATKKVLITISRGAVTDVKKPSDVAVEIRDYDIEGTDTPECRPDCKKDAYGSWYQKMVWGATK